MFNRSYFPQSYIYPRSQDVESDWGYAFSFERLATFPPQADYVLVDLFSSMADVADGGALWTKLPHKEPKWKQVKRRRWQ